MAVTFLTLCQSVHRKMRGGNAIPGSQPTVIPVATTPRQDQMVYDIVDAVALAWENLQNLHSGWKWMRKQGTLLLVAGQRLYTPVNIRTKIPDYDWMIAFDPGNVPPFVNMYDAGATVQTDNRVWYLEYEDWRGYVDRAPLPTNGMPYRLTQRPDYTLELDPTPAAAPSGGGWTLKLDYRTQNTQLAATADIVNLPDRFAEVIVWMAVEILCEERGSTALLAALAKRELYGDMRRQGRLTQLENDQLPVLIIESYYC